MTAAAEAAAAEETTGGLSEAEFIGAFYSQFYLRRQCTVGILFLQLFVVSRLFKYFGVPVAVLVAADPCCDRLSRRSLSIHVLSVVRCGEDRRERDTTIRCRTRCAMCCSYPTSREQKYKAKQVIDSFFVRIGDVLSARTGLRGNQSASVRHVAVRRR